MDAASTNRTRTAEVASLGKDLRTTPQPRIKESIVESILSIQPKDFRNTVLLNNKRQHEVNDATIILKTGRHV